AAGVDGPHRARIGGRRSGAARARRGAVASRGSAPLWWHRSPRAARCATDAPGTTPGDRGAATGATAGGEAAVGSAAAAGVIGPRGKLAAAASGNGQDHCDPGKWGVHVYPTSERRWGCIPSMPPVEHHLEGHDVLGRPAGDP